MSARKRSGRSGENPSPPPMYWPLEEREMMELSQTELESVLLREWPRIRAGHSFGSILPSAASRQWVRDGHAAGYVTLNYTVTPDAVVPEAQGEGRDGRATILEHYWSVRTKDGRQDHGWLPSLNVHVVHAYAHPPTVADCEAALRNAIALRRAALRAGDGCFDDKPRARCNVRALVLGPEIHDDVSVLAALEQAHGVGIVAARYRYSVADGFEFDAANEAHRFWDVGLLDVDAIRHVGERFFEGATLPENDFQWRGINDVPVFEGVPGLGLTDAVRR